MDLRDRSAGGREVLERVPADELVGTTLEESLGRSVDVGHAAVAIEPVDGVGNAGQQVALTRPRPVVVSLHASRSRPLVAGSARGEDTARNRPASPSVSGG
jgi:hypothetical protein